MPSTMVLHTIGESVDDENETEGALPPGHGEGTLSISRTVTKRIGIRLRMRYSDTAARSETEQGKSNRGSPCDYIAGSSKAGL